MKKFREEAQKLEQSEALRTARQKFQAVESEASKSSEVIKEKLDTIKGKVCVICIVITHVSKLFDILKGARSYRGSE